MTEARYTFRRGAEMQELVLMGSDVQRITEEDAGSIVAYANSQELAARICALLNGSVPSGTRA